MDLSAQCCADAIASEFRARLNPPTFHGMRWLCDRLGILVLVSTDLPARIGAQWQRGHIVLSQDLPTEEMIPAIAHELVHALADEERWSHLNEAVRTGMSREDFHELVATLTGRLMPGHYSCSFGEWVQINRFRLGLTVSDCAGRAHCVLSWWEGIECDHWRAPVPDRVVADVAIGLQLPTSEVRAAAR